ncbi:MULTISPECIES: Lrp/AsnC family transcriptional regulator [Clostridium]|uniref:Lrp/AsnC family transcriptional regulator n=1 Tax=Clostridium TaxID=1485 RepID=UPI0008258CFD|nr:MULTISPECIES: Lrp/AsnC family transcriptional regulator [Clostridium]PJI09576.1 Lrp/AsnC family transcriptional regulator [Clostridium sp. CT7]
MLDKTDIGILNLLIQNSRRRLQDVGEEVHLTGQGVKNRITKMEKMGIIEKYTLKINFHKLGKKVMAFVTIFMKTSNHMEFRNYINKSDIVVEAHRISGEGCYLLKVVAETQEKLVGFLDEILKYGNYKVNLSIEEIK